MRGVWRRSPGSIGPAVLLAAVPPAGVPEPAAPGAGRRHGRGRGDQLRDAGAAAGHHPRVPGAGTQAGQGTPSVGRRPPRRPGRGGTVTLRLERGSLTPAEGCQVSTVIHPGSRTPIRLPPRPVRPPQTALSGFLGPLWASDTTNPIPQDSRNGVRESLFW